MVEMENINDNPAEEAMHKTKEERFFEKEKKRVDVWRYKPYICQVREIDIYTGSRIILLNEREAAGHDIYSGYRTSLKVRGKEYAVLVDTSKELIKLGEVGVFKDVVKELGLREGDIVEIVHMNRPLSIEYIKKKLDGTALTANEISTIINDLMDNKLSEGELAAWVAAMYINGLTDDEIVSLTNSIVSSGELLDLGKQPVVDKHCLPDDVPTIVRNSNAVKVEPIGKIAEKAFERCKDNIHFEDGAEYVEGDLHGLQVLTYDNDGNTKFSPVSRVYRVKSPEYLYELTLIGNRTIRATSDHTVFTLRKGRIVNKPMKEIKAGDYVVVPASLEVEKPLTSIKIKTECETANKKFINTIKISKEFMRLLGYYLSAGFTNSKGIFFRFDSHENTLIEDTIRCIQKLFGIKAVVGKPHKTTITISVHNKTLSKIFGNTIKAGNSAAEKRIPSFIFDVNRDSKLEFLRALFKSGGYIRRGHEAVYVTASKSLSSDLQYFLSLMGAAVSVNKEKKKKFLPADKSGSNREKAFYIYTQANEILGRTRKVNIASVNLLPIKELGVIKKEKIGWKMRRQLKEQGYMTKEKLRTLSHAIVSEDVKKLLHGRLSVLKVKSLQKIKSKSEYVYDFKVPGHEKFVAGSAPICVHNCIGGVAGNRTTMIIVPIIAAAGLYIAKTSSRAITSPAGTADTMEVLCNVNIPPSQVKEIVTKTNGAIVWGGGIRLASADDKLIKIRNPLSLDPRGVLLASILAKKKSVGAQYIVIDIPVGRGAKISDYTMAESLAKDFIKIGKRLNMEIEALITDGSEPVGNGIGPALECRDVLQVLEGGGPEDLRHKSCLMAGKLLELSGKVEKDRGYEVAQHFIDSGKALEKMRQIIAAQGGNPNIKSSDIAIGQFVYEVTAEHSGKISHIDNKHISKIARIAGAPQDKGAGIYLYKVRGDHVEKGDKLFDIVATSEEKLSFAVKALKDLEPIEFQKILLGTIHGQ